MNRDRLVQWTAFGVLVVSLVLSALLNMRVASSQGNHQLVYTETAEDATTPEEALGIAAGAFRGIFVNWLWMRANDLKQEGKYYEAIDLAKTITRLQPRFPRVWAFHAWNLAYNISVATNTPDERWQWVNSGIRLLRDEGIPKNPQDLLLHKELAWIFIHKIQGISDDSNQFYKRQFAREWTIALGKPPARTAATRTTKAYTDALVRWMQNVAEAPGSLDDLIAREVELTKVLDTVEQPKTIEPLIPTLLARVKAEAGLDLTQMPDILRYRETYEESRSLAERGQDLNLGGTSANANDALLKLLTDPALQRAWILINRHLRHRVLVEYYHMEPDRMVRYMQKYGPLDWRLPHAHSLYWAARGVDVAQDRRNANTQVNMDFTNTDRLVIQSIQELYRYGQLLYDINTPMFYEVMNSKDYFDAYGEVLVEVMARERQEWQANKGVDMNERVWSLYRAGYENFLADAICYLYRSGEKDRARQYQQTLASWPGRVKNDIMRQDILEGPLDEFVADNLKDRITSPNIAEQEFGGALQNAFTNGLLAGDDEIFRTYLEYAKMVHAAYFKEQFRVTPTGKGDQIRMGVYSPNIVTAISQKFANFLLSVPPKDGAVIFLRAPDDLKITTWDLMDQQVRRYDPKGNPVQTEFDVWYPMPKGVIETRAAREAQQPKNTQEGKIEAK